MFITQNIYSITNLSVVALIISGLVCCEFSLRGLEAMTTFLVLCKFESSEACMCMYVLRIYPLLCRHRPVHELNIALATSEGCVPSDVHWCHMYIPILIPNLFIDICNLGILSLPSLLVVSPCCTLIIIIHGKVIQRAGRVETIYQGYYYYYYYYYY